MSATDQIQALFSNSEALTFAQIQQATALRSNLVAYAILQLQRKGLLMKEGDQYRLSSAAEQHIPYLAEEKSPLPIVLVRCYDAEGKALFVKRNKRPYLGLFGFPGGRMLLGESVATAALRLLKSKTFIDAEFIGVHAVCNERVIEAGASLHGFVMLIVDVKARSAVAAKPSICWVTSATANEADTVPSDYYFLTANAGIYECVLTTKDDGSFVTTIESIAMPRTEQTLTR